MVSIGRSVEDLVANPSDDSNAAYSVEFCGGTHLADTSGAPFLTSCSYSTLHAIKLIPPPPSPPASTQPSSLLPLLPLQQSDLEATTAVP